MNEEHNLIDILISVFLKQETYFSPECRSNVLIIENLGNTEKYNEKENIIHECITKHILISIYFPFN